MSSFLHDLRHAVRSLSKSPGFTAVAVLTMALGIGATTAVYSVVRAVFLRPLPFRDAARLAIVWETDLHNGERNGGVSFPDLTDWRRENRSFSAIAAYRRLDLNLADPGREPDRVAVATVTANLFPLLGVAPVLGRPLSPDDDREGAPPAVLLSHALWQSRYGSSPSVVGRTIAIDGIPSTIVGVMPAGFEFPARAAAWMALTPMLGAFRTERGVHAMLAVARLADGVSIEAAGAEMGAIAARLARAYPNENAGRGARVQGLADALVGDLRREFAILFAAVVAVTLVACANVSGLLLARSRGRAREIAIRRALGAGAADVGGPLLAEALLLAVAGGGAGLLLAAWGIRGLLALSPDTIPRIAEVRLDLPVLLFTLTASLGAGILSALAPLGRVVSGREGSLERAGSGRASRETLRGAMVVGQVALAGMLATAAALLAVSLRNLERVDPGFRAEGLLTAELVLPRSKYPEPPHTEDFYKWPEVLRFYAGFLPKLQSLPGAASASFALNHPLMAGWTSEIQIEDLVHRPGDRDEVYIRPVAPGYFRTVASPVLAGRDFDDRDRQGSAEVLIVNSAFERRYFPRQGALGHTVSFWSRPRRIVGVVGDVRFLGPGSEPAPAVYPCLLQVPMNSLAVVVRAPAGIDPAALAPALRHALQDVDPDVALFHVRTASALASESFGSPRFRALLLTLFGAVALLLAAIGLYGLLSFGVSRRAREFGIRVALGAQRTDVARLVLREAGARAAAGIALGALGAIGAARLLSGLLFGVRPAEPAVFATVAVLLAMTAAAAAYLPARRATRVDPAVSLRTE